MKTIYERRIAHHLSLTELSWMLGMEHPHLKRIEEEIDRGYKRPPTRQQRVTAEAVFLLLEYGLKEKLVQRLGAMYAEHDPRLATTAPNRILKITNRPVEVKDESAGSL